MLSEKVCIVAGAGRGLGEAVAIELAEQGAKVVVNDLGVDLTGGDESKKPARGTVDAIDDRGGTASTHFGDISSLDYTERLVDDTVARYGRVDGVANFAGILRDSICYKMTGEEWDAVIDVHLRGHFALLRNVAAHWREVARDTDDHLESQRSFLAVSSRAALGTIGQINYSTAKAGVLGLARSAARELIQYNVRVNALMPSAYTRMIDSIPEEKRSYTKEEKPPGKVAPIVTFLMSDESVDITGCTFRASGDGVGIVSDPEVRRVAYRSGGWTAEDIVRAFPETIGEGANLKRIERTGDI